MSEANFSQMMLPRERIEQLENVNAELRRQLANAESDCRQRIKADRLYCMSHGGEVAQQVAAENAELKEKLATLEHREAAMCDLHYANGAKAGFSWGQHNDNESLKKCVEDRTPESVRALMATREKTENNQ